MRIQMQEGNSASELQYKSWQLALVGAPVDDRGLAAVKFANESASETRSMSYAPDSFTVNHGGEVRNAEELEVAVSSDVNKSILLETTTLGFVEIFLTAKALKSAGCTNLELLYVEPGEYTSPRRTQLLHKRDFELSDEVPGYKGIPGATLVTTDRTSQRAVFFLGYEERRLDVALQTQIVRPSDVYVVFGVPAFTPGWEMNAFANNIRVIRDNNVSGGVHFCGAESPEAAFGILTEIYESLLPGERLIVGPIGTKPNGIGAALFAATHEDVGLFYDHPKKSAKRSTGVARWHLYTVEF
jgi:hypothetical protein